MSRPVGFDDQIVVGREPRVHLLPPEVGLQRKFQALRRNLLISIGVVLLLVGGVVGASWWLAANAESQLASAQQRTADLLVEQGKYAEVRQVQSALDGAIAAREIGGSTEINWKDYLDSVRRVLPKDVTIDGVEIAAASPLVPPEIPTVPLQGERVATMLLTVTSPTLPAVPDWLEAMTALPGYADATPGAIDETNGAYVVKVTLHIEKTAFTNRFADVEEK